MSNRHGRNRRVLFHQLEQRLGLRFGEARHHRMHLRLLLAQLFVLEPLIATKGLRQLCNEFLVLGLYNFNWRQDQGYRATPWLPIWLRSRFVETADLRSSDKAWRQEQCTSPPQIQERPHRKPSPRFRSRLSRYRKCNLSRFL